MDIVDILDRAVQMQWDSLQTLCARLQKILSNPLRRSGGGSILEANKRSDLRKDTKE